MSITATNVNLFLDHQCRIYARLKGGSSYGMGVTGDTDKAQGAVTDLLAALLATADSSTILGMQTDVIAYQASLQAIKPGTSRAVLSRIETLVRNLGLSGVNSLDQYLTYYNYGSGGTNTALQNPYFYDIFYQWKGAYPTKYNLYFEILQGTVYGGTTYTNALRKLVVGTGETAGTAVDTAKYCGGVPYLNCTVFAGASGLVTVTGTQYDPATRIFTTGKTWTGTIAATGRVALASGGGSAASANALITAVSGISAAGTITAGATIYVEASKPSGRLAVPF